MMKQNTTIKNSTLQKRYSIVMAMCVLLITTVSVVLPIVLLACEESTSGNGTDTDTKPTAIKKVSIEEFTLNALKDIANTRKH